MNSKINKILIAVAIIVGSIYGVIRISDADIYGALICFAIIPVMLAPYLLRKLFDIKVSNQVETIYLIFVFFAHFLGSIVDFYHTILYYDKVMHLLSGLLSALLGFVLLVKMKHYKSKSIVFNVIFIIAITLSIAALWEFYEFTADYLFSKDAQNVVTTGVSDTMWDMIMAFFGSIMVSLEYLRETIKKKKSVIMGFIEEVGV